MFPTFTALSSAWLFLLLVPLVAFYFLKLKRPRQVVPSLVLWRQVLADQRVNSPFQRFKRNILLLLQILLLLLLVLAAMQPILRRVASGATRLPVLIDVSASMAGLDKAGGQSRLDAAKAKIRALIDTLPSDQEVCLIAFARTARRLTGFTNNRTELRDALATLEVDDVPGDLDEALRLAQALARTAPFDRIWLISDGNFPARANFELSFQIDFQRLAPAGPNFGITTLNARRALGGQWDIFVQLTGSADAESTSGTVELRQGENLLGSEKVALVKGSAPRLSFRVGGGEAVSLQARYIPSDFDSLASDNAAWLTLPAVRPLSVYVPPTLTAFRHALASLPGVNVFPDEAGTKQAGYDLVISNEDADLQLPARASCSIGHVPAELEKLVSLVAENSRIIDWRRDSPLLQHASLDDVVLMDTPHRASDATEASFRDLGYEILADGVQGPVILEKRDGDMLRVILLFQPERSTLPYRVGFPVLVSNLVQIALKQAQLAEVAAAPTGVLPPLTLTADRTVQVEGPANFRATARTDARGLLTGIPAPRAGEYSITGDAGSVRAGVSVLSPAETALTAVDQIEFNEQLKVTAATGALRSDRSLWWGLSAIALGVLVVEWWWFNRRPAPTFAR
jgi:Ca-activated chloride channel family protein